MDRRTAQLRSAKEETETLLKKVEEANLELNDFAHIVSHDLKAPLRGISSLAGWVKEDEGARLSEEGRGRLDMLQGRVRRMGDLIDGILRYSRVGREGVETEDVDLPQIVSGVIDMLAAPASVSLSVEGALPVVRGVPVLLQQVFQNLIGNAVKYMDKPRGEVKISCDDGEEGFCRFTVSDNGPGIDEKYFDKIFQIFQPSPPGTSGRAPASASPS